MDTVRATRDRVRMAAWLAYARINQIRTNVVNNFSRN